MFNRIVVMAAASNYKGQLLKAHNLPMAKGGNGQYYAAAVQSKPPTGRFWGSSHSETLLENGFKNLHLSNSRSSANSHRSSQQSFSASCRPINPRNLPDVAAMIYKNQVKNIIIVAGAGISTPSGIPDFRSPGTGLYDNLQEYSIPYPEAIFDIDYFQHNPWPFFTLAKELYPSGRYRPNYIHYFARLLHDHGILLRMYTQNIDGLERIAGLPAEKLVEAHGSFSTATCTLCKQKYDGEDIKEKILAEKLPICKRTSCSGIIKPDIVFFGEELPKRFYCYLKDMLQTDLVLVMGTSLEVQPFAGIIDTVRFTVPRVLFNRIAVGPFCKQKRPKDFVSEGDLIVQMQEFVQMVGWTKNMVDLITCKEGSFKTAFPPPPLLQRKDGKRKMSPIKFDPLTVMWHQNAQTHFFSDSDETSDSDSQTTLSDESDTSTSESEISDTLGNMRAIGKRGTVKKEKSEYDSKTNDRQTHGTSNAKPSSSGNNSKSFQSTGKVKGGNPSGPLLSKRFLDSGDGVESQQDSHNTPTNTRGKKKKNFPQFVLANGSQQLTWTGATAAMAKELDIFSKQKKIPITINKFPNQQNLHHAQQRHTFKPRSNSVNKAVPEKVHSTTVQRFKSVYPRITSALPSGLDYQHFMLSQHETRSATIDSKISDSSSSGDGNDDSSDDSSDDSR